MRRTSPEEGENDCGDHVGSVIIVTQSFRRFTSDTEQDPPDVLPSQLHQSLSSTA